MQKQVLHNQSLFDIAIQDNGTIMSCFEIAFKNGQSLTDELTPGQFIDVPVSVLIDVELVDFFKNKNHLIATGFNGSEHEDIVPKIGIGKMAIGSTFIVG